MSKWSIGFFLVIAFTQFAFPKDPNPFLLVERAEKQVRGDSFAGQLKMIVEKSGQSRTLELKSWMKGDDHSLVRILSPAKDKGSGNLRIKMELWQYLPKVERVVKIPPSMMLQSWMGSDFSNDDLVKSSSLARDYTHKLLGLETANGQKSFKIECLPKKDAKIVWGKVLLWVRESDSSPVKQEFYSEKGKLQKTFDGFEHKSFGKRTIPTKVVMTPAGVTDQKTTLEYIEAKFDLKLPDSLFTQEKLRSDIED
jgi:outer membrane lipoprotein-sorting protein